MKCAHSRGSSWIICSTSRTSSTNHFCRKRIHLKTKSTLISFSLGSKLYTFYFLLQICFFFNNAYSMQLFIHPTGILSLNYFISVFNLSSDYTETWKTGCNDVNFLSYFSLIISLISFSLTFPVDSFLGFDGFGFLSFLTRSAEGAK